MPIEFSCRSCKKLLRVPDGTEGRTCQCAACGEVSVVPDARSKPMPAAEAGIDDGLIRVTCPRCQYPLRCKVELKGTKGQCKQCKHIFLIGDTAPVLDEAPVLVFDCPKCQQLFDGKPEMEGRKGKCHACGEVFHIKLRRADSLGSSISTSNPTPQPTPSQNISQAGSPAPKPTSVASDQIQVICGSCQRLMQVPSNSAGKTFSCPHCSQLLQIPGSSRSPTNVSVFDQAEEVEGILETHAHSNSSPFSFGPSTSGLSTNTYQTPAPSPYSPAGPYSSPPAPYTPAPGYYVPNPSPYPASNPHSTPAPTGNSAAHQYLEDAEHHLRHDGGISGTSAKESLRNSRIILFGVAVVQCTFIVVGLLFFSLEVGQIEQKDANLAQGLTIIKFVVLACALCLTALFIGLSFLITKLPLTSALIAFFTHFILALLINIARPNLIRIGLDVGTFAALCVVVVDAINCRRYV